MASAEDAGPQPLPFAPCGRRVAALVLDLAILLAALLLVLNGEYSLAGGAGVEWLVLLWALLVAPLYFALYHGRGSGRTPGEREVGIGHRRADGVRPVGILRALASAYGGVLAAALVLPLLADALSHLGHAHRGWHDRLLGEVVVRLPDVPAEAASAPTAAEVSALFEEPGKAVARAWRLVRRRSVPIVGAALVAYVGLVLLGVLLVPLLVADLTDPLDTIAGLVAWSLLATMLFASGVYWALAAITSAVEAVRVGGHGVSPVEGLRRASTRANGLTVAVLLLGVLASLVPVTMFAAVVPLARFVLVVPVLLVEERPTLRAFGRSWRLTRRKSAASVGLLVGSAIAVGIATGTAVAIASAALGALSPDAGVLTYTVAYAAALLVASVPVSVVLAVVGTTWCLRYYDLRRAEEARACSL